MALTLPYKRVQNISINLDIYPPITHSVGTDSVVRAVVYFHGGGLTVGNTNSWSPEWLKCVSLAFIQM
jgi:acetyl esterase/lipase